MTHVKLVCLGFRIKIRNYHNFYLNRPDRETSDLGNELPEESDQFRFLRVVCFANLKGAVGLIMVKVSTSTTLVKGLSYNSSRNENSIDLDKYAHGQTRAHKVTNKTCLLCVWTYYYRPNLCRQLLGVSGADDTSHVQLWPRDRCRVENLTIRWTWSCLAKRLVLLTH